MENFESLSMVIFDNAYNGEEFVMSSCVFKDEIQPNDNKLIIPINKVGDKICVIFVDMYGNDFKQVF